MGGGEGEDSLREGSIPIIGPCLWMAAASGQEMEGQSPLGEASGIPGRQTEEDRTYPLGAGKLGMKVRAVTEGCSELRVVKRKREEDFFFLLEWKGESGA